MRMTQARRKQIDDAVGMIRENMAVYGTAFTSPDVVKDFLTLRLAAVDKERFLVMFLTQDHKLIKDEIMFEGTINESAVYPREVVKRALELNAAAVVLAHNHPSGNTMPSRADMNITTKLVDALGIMGVRVLDHVIVGKECSSFMEMDLL